MKNDGAGIAFKRCRRPSVRPSSCRCKRGVSISIPGHETKRNASLKKTEVWVFSSLATKPNAPRSKQTEVWVVPSLIPKRNEMPLLENQARNTKVRHRMYDIIVRVKLKPQG